MTSVRRECFWRHPGTHREVESAWDERPMGKNAPTAKSLVIADERDLGAEQKRLSALVDRSASAGPQGFTTHPQIFFGPLTPAEWAMLMYKHLDHHLGQFGV